MAEELIPLNAFKSVLTTLTGDDDVVYSAPKGVSTILLSAQITNTGTTDEPVTISITSNRDLPVPQVDSISNSGSFLSASALIAKNQTFLEKESAAYTNFQNNLTQIPFSFTSSFFEGYVRTAVDGVEADLIEGGTLQSKKAALSYYNKNGEILIPNDYYTASYQSIDYANLLVQQILINESVTGSIDIPRLYQDSVTQSFDNTLIAESGSISASVNLFDAISDTISNPTRVEQEPVDLITNVTIPAGDSLSPIVAGKLVLEQQFSLIVSGSTDLTVILSILESANE
jgi:hypothetical protein|tara:strand:+ start:176 stop:1036 length:861 start_codon:yes stop_codon:yes gene_type:complete